MHVTTKRNDKQNNKIKDKGMADGCPNGRPTITSLTLFIPFSFLPFVLPSSFSSFSSFLLFFFLIQLSNLFAVS